MLMNVSQHEVVEDLCGNEHVVQMMHLFLAPAILVSAIFAFLEKRTDKCIKCCRGHPGLVPSLNMLDDYRHRWGYAVGFGSITNTIVFLFTGGQYMDFEGGTVVKVMTGLWVAVQCCIVYFPLFASLASSYKIFGAAVGVCYSGCWLFLNLYGTANCINPVPDLLPYATLVVQIPTLSCLTFLFIKFIRMLIEFVVYRGANLEQSDNEIAFQFQIDYTKNIFAKNKRNDEDPEQLSWCSRIIRILTKYIYRNNPLFRFSTRVLCSIFVVFCCTYQMGVLFYYGGAVLVDWLETQTTSLINSTGAEENSTTVQNIYVALDMLHTSLELVTLITLFSYAIVIFCVLRNYRKHILQMFRGDHAFFPSDYSTNSADKLRRCMMFAGYQIAYMLWGYFIFNFVFWIIALILCFVIILPIMNGISGIMKAIVSIIVFPLIVSFLLRLGETVMADKVFLQDKVYPTDDDKPLAITNRKLYYMTDYFYFLANIEVGLFSCLYRIMKTFIWGLVLLGRMDRSVLMPGLENKDKGYMAYLGLLEVEHAHNHPVLRVFCQILVDLIPPGCHRHLSQYSQELKGECFYQGNDDSDVRPMSFTNNQLVSEEKVSPLAVKNRARQRWHLAYTLIRNPDLVMRRHRSEWQLLEKHGHIENAMELYKQAKLSAKAFMKDIKMAKKIKKMEDKIRRSSMSKDNLPVDESDEDSMNNHCDSGSDVDSAEEEEQEEVEANRFLRLYLNLFRVKLEDVDTNSDPKPPINFKGLVQRLGSGIDSVPSGKNQQTTESKNGLTHEEMVLPSEENKGDEKTIENGHLVVASSANASEDNSYNNVSDKHDKQLDN